MCRFPKQSDRANQWAVKLRRMDSTTGHLWQPGPGAMLCSLHFHPDDYVTQWGRKLLKNDAVPTVFSYAPARARRKLPTSRSAAPEPASTSSSDNNKSDGTAALQQPTVTNTVSVAAADHAYPVISPRKLHRRNAELVQKLEAKRAEVRNARRRETRLRGKLADVLLKLRRKHLLSTQAENLLEEYKDIPLSLFRGKSGRSLSTEQRQFATTLHYYSPASYKFLRQKVKSLPNPRTIRAWLASFDGRPGLTEQSFATIAEKIAGPDEWKYRICALHIDEMEVKKHLELDRRTGRIHGFTDLGPGKQFLNELTSVQNTL